MATLALLFFALAALIATPSLLAAATSAPDGQSPEGPATGPADGPHQAKTAAHAHESGPYSAQGLTSARWDIGAIQAGWTDRPFWQAPVTGEGTRVAVIDTGIDPGHPDLRDRIVAWRDFVNDREHPYDDTGHGTHVAGIIAGDGHTQLNPLQPYFFTGARGVAPGADLMAAKVMDENGQGDPARIADAILWALNPDGDNDPEKSANIINLSLGIGITTQNNDPHSMDMANLLGPGSSSQMRQVQDAIRTATEAGAVVVVAAGNHDPHEPGEILFPGTMEEVITVGALNERGQIAAFSNQGAPGSNKPDLVAPGVILSSAPNEGGKGLYKGLGGTSMAAPFVSGTIALIMESEPSLKGISFHEDRSGHTDTARTLLKDAAMPVPGAGPHEQGAGSLRVDATLAQIDAGTGDVRNAAYIAPLMVAGSGMLLVRRLRRRHTVTRPGPSPDSVVDLPRDLPPAISGHEGQQRAPMGIQARGGGDRWHAPHHGPSIPLRPIAAPWLNPSPPRARSMAKAEGIRRPVQDPRHPRARGPHGPAPGPYRPETGPSATHDLAGDDTTRH